MIHPSDLRERRFRPAFRGVSRWEVRELLGAAAADLEAAIAEVEGLRSQLAAAGARLFAARAEEREATRLLSQAEAEGRRRREEADRLAAEMSGTAAARLAAMLREAEAERDLLAARIAQGLDYQRRIETVLQGEVNDLDEFLRSEPVLEPLVAPAVHMPPPPFARPEAAPAPGPAEDDGTWSAADVQQALAVATARRPDGKDDAAGGAPAAARWAGRPGGRWIAAGLAAAVVMIAMAGPGGGRQPSITAAGLHAPRTTPKAAVSRVPGPVRPDAAPAPDTPPAVQPPAAVPDGAMRVTLEAVRPCWVRVTADGRTDERVLQAGESMTLDSRTDMLLRTGNAGALVITIDGRAIPPLGGEGQIVTRRLTRPTPEP